MQSDHKPLESSMKKDLVDVSVRLQRLMMRLLKYDQMEVVFKPGNQMLVADCLSSSQMKETEEDRDLTKAIHGVIKRACMAEDKEGEDEGLMRVCRYVEEEWPVYHKMDDFSQEFYNLKDHLHYENGILFYGDRMVVSKRLQSSICKQAHMAHLGVEKTLNRAKTLYFWLGMNEEIKKEVEMCRVCEKFQRLNQKETLKQDEVPEYPFNRVVIDICYWNGKEYLVVYDEYSNYVTVHELGSKAVQEIVRKLRATFSAVGYPTVIRADNSPFNSNEFRQFASECCSI